MPSTIAPAPLADYTPPEGDNDALSHLIGISMDQYGYPIRLFATNRWVTGEVWYAADDVIAMLDLFNMDLAYPSLPANLWITAMLRLFRPDIEALVRARDQKMAAHRQPDPDTSVYEDRGLEITSFLDISVDKHVDRVNSALARK